MAPRPADVLEGLFLNNIEALLVTKITVKVPDGNDTMKDPKALFQPRHVALGSHLNPEAVVNTTRVLV